MEQNFYTRDAVSPRLESVSYYSHVLPLEAEDLLMCEFRLAQLKLQLTQLTNKNPPAGGEPPFFINPVPETSVVVNCSLITFN